ncbi:MAG: metallophosphoesterase [Planctomycetaceae bacterium]|nr:MAG: metallophosphoesterase [Planctomycetaceae bacterium]
MTFDWTNALLMGLVVIGNVLFFVGVFNRGHGAGLGKIGLRCIHWAHNLGIFAGNLAWLVLAGLTGPRLLWGGSWRDLSIWLRVYAIVCGSALVLWLINLVLRKLTPRPRQIVGRTVERRDLESELTQPARGAGPYRFMQSVPGNEFLHLEIVRLELLLPRLPPALDGLTIVHLSDLHLIGNVGLPYFQRLFEIARSLSGDVAVCTGDVIDDMELVDWLDPTFGILQAPLGSFFILGNHDWQWGDPATTRNRLATLGWRDAAAGCTQVEHHGATLAIAGDERPWMGAEPDWSATPSDAFRLLLSHTPDNFGLARRNRVDLMLAGHTHGGQVRLPFIGPVYSPSWHGVRFASGTFWTDPTLMHVSQGIAGRHPWRWNCLPELAHITLRAGPPESTATVSR